jgi:ubiquinone/menaquinone biosynthesis C-methylase UbiE
MHPDEAGHRPMQRYWTQSATYTDPRAFDTTRFSADNLAFWMPHLTRVGQVTPSTLVLDLGCGTGGHTLALQALTGARLVGVDLSLRLLQYAAQKPAGAWWVQGNAEALPFAGATFARIVLSLVLHQLLYRARALVEVARVLQDKGLVIIRTITPEAARTRIPFRFFPTVAEIEAVRMPTIADTEGLLSGAGFELVQAEVVQRDKALNFQAVLTEFQKRPSYQALTPEEFTRGMTAMREAWQRSDGRVVDPRPTLFMVGQKRGL